MTYARVSTPVRRPARPAPRSGTPSPTPALLVLQRAAGNRAVARQLQRCGPTPCDCSDEERADYSASVQRNAEEDLGEFIGQDLSSYAASHPTPYAHIREVFAGLDPDVEDNVAAEFTARQSSEQLEHYAASPEGLAMLDVLTEAMITGHVTSNETVQAERILVAKGRWITADQHAAAAGRIAGLRHRAEDSLHQLALNEVAMDLARSLVPQVVGRRYDAVSTAIREVDTGAEDNVASHLLELLRTPVLEEAAQDPVGRTMLDLLYDAVITGSVTAFERLQGDRILEAKAKATTPTGEDLAKVMENPSIFPLATGWDSTATIVAELADGRVKVYYDTHRGANRPEFQPEINTLRRRFGDQAVFDGMFLRPDELVVVKLYDQDGVMVPVPALKLIDYFNQQKEDTLGKIEQVSILGATAGVGGIGGAGVLGWADTVAFAISAGSLFVNAYRADIAKTRFGRGFLQAWDVAEGVAQYYGWARMGVDGLRLVQAKVAPAFARWRAEAPTGLTAAERETIGQAQQKTEAWLEGVKQAEATEVAKAEAKAATKAPAGGPEGPAAGVEPAEPSTTRPAATAPPKAPDASKVVAGGHSEVHVTQHDIVVCQLCSKLSDAVGGAITDGKVAREVGDAERAAARGDAAGAAGRAEVAVLDAEKVNAKALASQKARYSREFSVDPTLSRDWKRVKAMKAGPDRAAAARSLETRAGQLKAANDKVVTGVQEQAAQLRARAMSDANAAHDLADLYRAQPGWVLDDLERLEDEAVAAMKRDKRKPVDRQRRRDPLLGEEAERKHLVASDAAWAERDYRMPHEAEVWVNGRGGRRLRGDRFTSGGVRDLDVVEHGFNEANTLSHTEAKALRELGLHPGETMYINGRYEPCRFCVARMKKAVDTFGGTVVYGWPGGPAGGMRFRR